MVETVAVVVESSLGVVILCREAVTEEVGERARLRDGVAEGIVGILRNRVAIRIEVAGNIAVVVVERDVDSVIDCKVQQPADAACALRRAGEVFAPIVVDYRGCAVCVGDSLFYEVPIIVEKSSCGFRRQLADTAGFRIVKVRQSEDTVCRYGLEAIGGIVGECADAIGKQIAVEVVGELCVLVEAVWRV